MSSMYACFSLWVSFTVGNSTSVLALQGFYFEVLLEAIGAELAANSRLPVATKGRYRIEGTPVDDHAPGSHPPRHGHGPIAVLTPHRTGQPVAAVVGDGDGVVIVPVRDEADHRAKDFFLRDLQLRPHTAEDGGLEEVPVIQSIGSVRAASDDPRSVGYRSLDVASHPVALGGGNERAHVGGRVQREADPYRPGRLPGGSFRLVEVALRDEHPGQGGAILPTVADGLPNRGSDHLRHVDIVEYQAGRLSAELERNLLGRLGREAHDGPPGSQRTGERDDVDARMAGDRLTDGGAIAVHEVEHTRREANLVNNLRQGQCAQRGNLAGLSDHGAAGPEGRGALGRELMQGVVPGRDRPRHPGRLAQDDRRARRVFPLKAGHDLAHALED